jgi:hypothetical protein
MIKSANKVPLNLELYGNYQIPQTYMAFTVQFKNLNDSECENIEYEYTVSGYKIFHSEMERGNIGKFNLKLIVAKSEITF